MVEIITFGWWLVGDITPRRTPIPKPVVPRLLGATIPRWCPATCDHRLDRDDPTI